MGNRAIKKKKRHLTEIDFARTDPRPKFPIPKDTCVPIIMTRSAYVHTYQCCTDNLLNMSMQPIANLQQWIDV